MGLATDDEFDSRVRCSRGHASNAVKSGALCSLRARGRSSALWPLLPHSLSNSASMRLTASRAIGEIAAAFLSRLALAAMSANSKNCRLAWAQQSAGVIGPCAREAADFAAELPSC